MRLLPNEGRCVLAPAFACLAECFDDVKLELGQARDGTEDCADGEDERFCRAGARRFRGADPDVCVMAKG